MCCFFCLRALCDRHKVCSCAESMTRRRDVAVAVRGGKSMPLLRCSRVPSVPSHVTRFVSVAAPVPTIIPPEVMAPETVLVRLRSLNLLSDNVDS